MRKYLSTVKNVLSNGSYEHNRTGIDTITGFSENYKIDLSEGFPLMTTKKMDGFRWNSIVREFVWYLSGQHHIKQLREETSVWDTWADDEGYLPTAYGRFWRRYPVPRREHHLTGEWWANGENIEQQASEFYDIDEREVADVISRWVNEETRDDGTSVKTFDQLQYVVDTLNDENPLRGPRSRRLIVTAWHPVNAAISHLPPCHFEYIINIQNGKLNCHLTQRSADIAVGVPFNISSYALLTHLLANQTGYEVGQFGHTLVDCHAYCGGGERGEWYSENLEQLQSRIDRVSNLKEYEQVREWILSNAPSDDSAGDISDSNYGDDHIPGLLEQLAREPKQKPELSLSDGAGINNISYDDFELSGYESDEGLRFGVAE
jgi:thymidylate synthase